jgi:TIR domain
MIAATFAEYAINYAEEARKTRLALPPQLRQTVDEIEAELASNPNKYPERTSAASRDGTVLIYRHPLPKLEIAFEVDRDKKILYLFHYFAPTVAPQQTIFISYSHQDEDWLAKLRVFLAVLEQQGLINFWDDSKIEPGRPWEEQIRGVLDSSKAGLLLVSQHFLISKFVKDVELAKLLEAAKGAGKQIFWLPLSPSTVFSSHKEITQFQALVADPHKTLQELADVEQKKVFVDVTEKLRNCATAWN